MEIQKTLTGNIPSPESTIQVSEFSMKAGTASTDLGDVSWNIPTTELVTATWVPGTPAHSWQAVAAGGTSIGSKGMMVAAKTLTLSAIDLFNDQTLIDNAWKEFRMKRGVDFKYEALLGNRAPALNYRD
jgi:aminobenzoyl-glutamate utilization protein B